jgi:nitroimidazol reductase NimA-like FMN-containing flavoprotein (pyridoxamine 5'-phosphate oxidase superfamily)
MKALLVSAAAVVVAGCGIGTPSELERIGECARAVNLQAEAMERAHRPSAEKSALVADAANEAIIAAARYRKMACKDDAYLRMP